MNVIKNLKIHNVNLKGTVLKPNMILPGSSCKKKAIYRRNSQKNIRMFKKNMPSEVPGVAFLSGGQSEVEATKNLNEINKINDTSFQFYFFLWKSITTICFKNLGKINERYKKIQKVFDHRAKMNGASTEAKWDEKLEQSFAA